MKHYDAIIWSSDPKQPGERVTILANDLADAQKILEEQYGEDRIYSLKNKEDAARLR